MSWEALQRVYSGVTYMYDALAERCVLKGVGQFADPGAVAPDDHRKGCPS